LPIRIVVSVPGVSSRDYYKATRAAWRRSLRWRFIAAAIFVAGLATGASYLVPHHHEFMFGWCAGIGTGMLWALWDSPPAFIENWRQGAEGEERTGKELARLEPLGWQVRHDLPDEYGNIDHVAVGPAGVFLLDTKSWGGEIRIEDGVVVQRRSLSPRNNFRDFRLPGRMRGAAVGLRDRLRDTTGFDQRVTAVVVLWGTFPQSLLEADQVVYIAGERLADWLSSRPVRLDRRTQNLFTLALDSGLAVSA
jgi:hypothetical protein